MCIRKKDITHTSLFLHLYQNLTFVVFGWLFFFPLSVFLSLQDMQMFLEQDGMEHNWCK